MSSGDIEARLGLSLLGKNVLEKALVQFRPSSWIVGLITAQMVENIFYNSVELILLDSQACRAVASDDE